MPDEFDRESVDRLLTTTRSVRRRLDRSKTVDSTLIDECLTLALQAPNGSGTERWRFIVVTDQRVRARIGELYKRASDQYVDHLRETNPNLDETTATFRSSQTLWNHLGEVPAHVIPCVEREAWHDTSAQRSYVNASLYASMYPATWSFQLACRSRGLGTCFVTSILKYETELRDLLTIPTSFVVGGLVAVAHTSGSFAQARRQPLEAVRRFNQWTSEQDR